MPGRKPLIIAAALAAAALAGWRFPLFRIVPLQQVRETQQAARFDAARVAAEFWERKLPTAVTRAPELSVLLTALAKDSAAARQQYGRTLGIGGATLFLVRGSGRVVALEDDAVIVDCGRPGPPVKLATGLIFGNTVRDVTGQLDVSLYPNSQDFNELSTQLNALVEAKVVAALKRLAAVGKTIQFAGCRELEEGAQPEALAVIPLQIDWP